jgi:hypothetical protein
MSSRDSEEILKLRAPDLDLAPQPHSERYLARFCIIRAGNGEIAKPYTWLCWGARSSFEWK